MENENNKRVELAVHTAYSRMKSDISCSELIDYTIENEINAIAITDVGNVASFADLYTEKLQKHAPIKLIMGADILVFDDQLGEGRLSILVMDDRGRSNLFNLLSERERRYKKEGDIEPHVPLSVLLQYKEGLLIGSGSSCDSIVIKALDVLDFGTSEYLEDLNMKSVESFNFLNYVEIPDENLSSSRVEKLLKLSLVLTVPAVAVSSPFFLDNGPAYFFLNKDISDIKGNSFETDAELMEKLQEVENTEAVVIDNSRFISAVCEEVNPCPQDDFLPYVDKQDEILKAMCEEALNRKFDIDTDEIRNRLDWELNAIRKSRCAFVFLQIDYVLKKTGLNSFEFNTRGMAGCSLVCYLLDITEIDPIENKLTPYFLYGDDGHRFPDIDINVPISKRQDCLDALKVAPGVGSIAIAGTVMHLSETETDRMVDEYIKENDGYSEFDTEVLRNRLSNCICCHGKHPARVYVLPEGVSVTDICPITVLDDRTEVTAYRNLELFANVYRLDVFQHPFQTMLSRLFELTEVDPSSISLTDDSVLNLLNKASIVSDIPVFTNENFTRDLVYAIKVTGVNSFEDLVTIFCFLNTCIDSPEDFYKKFSLDQLRLICNREDLYNYLIECGIESETGYKIVEDVRRGKVALGLCDEWHNYQMTLEEKGVLEYVILYIQLTVYLFSRSSAYSYMLAYWRIMWFYINYRLEYDQVLAEIETTRKRGKK